MSGESSPELRRANVGGLLTEAARQHADRVAIRCDDQCLTYRELNARVNALAAGLTDLGLAAGAGQCRSAGSARSSSGDPR
jgi:non-ribosomal peptide synthetase component E (peptide arylation enzyme)